MKTPGILFESFTIRTLSLKQGRNDFHMVLKTLPRLSPNLALWLSLGAGVSKRDSSLAGSPLKFHPSSSLPPQLTPHSHK